MLVGGHAGSNGQLSAPHYLQFAGLEMSWGCQAGYLFGPSGSGWPPDSLGADQMAAMLLTGPASGAGGS